MTVFADWGHVPDEGAMRSCYLASHPDAARWLPNDEDAAHIVSPFLDRDRKLKGNHLLHRPTGRALIRR